MEHRIENLISFDTYIHTYISIYISQPFPHDFGYDKKLEPMIKQLFLPTVFGVDL